MGIKEILEIKGYIINLVSMYPRTVFEVRKKLVEKGYSEDDIEQSINELQAKKYLDDEQYALKWIEQQLDNRPCGKLLCKAQMLKRGVPEDIIDKVLREEYMDEKEYMIARKISQAKISILARNNKISKDALRRKLGYYLKNKGFSAGIIMETLNEEL